MNNYADHGIDLPGGSGGEVHAICPQCSHDRKKKRAKCLSVNTDKGCWLCHHCGWTGSLISDEIRRMDRPKVYTKPVYIQRPPDMPLLEWFAKRRIPKSVVERNGITPVTEYMPQLEQEAPCIAFPYVRDGSTVNVKFRTLEGKHFRQVANAEKLLYGLDDLTSEWAVITEGEMDKLSLEAAGILNAVSVPDGAPPTGSKPTDAKFEYLVNCEEQLKRLTKIVLAVDSDGPGKTLEEELARRLGLERCWRATWPDGCKDSNDVLVRFGPEVLRQCIEDAKPYPIEGVIEVADVLEDVFRLYEKGLPGGVSTGCPAIDRLYTVRPGELSIVTGIPSHGKSEWLDWLAVNLAVVHGFSIAICSPKNFPISRHIAKLVEKYVGLPFRSGPTERMSHKQLHEALQWVQEHFVFIAPEDAITVSALLNTGKQLVVRRGIRGLIIDPWNEFDHKRPNNITETEYISQSLGAVRRFARMHGVHVWVVAHPMKLSRVKDKDGNLAGYPVPTPYDISGSAHWRNKADCCLTIWRDLHEDRELAQLHIQKVRFREVGSPGVVALRWNPKNGRYAAAGSSTHEQEINDAD